jgi:2-dehydropantoate 2-reductase
VTAPDGPEAATRAGAAPKRVSIIGAGSLGLAFSAALSHSGHLVTLLARPGSAGDLLERGNIEVTGRLSFSVPLSTVPARPGQVAVAERGRELPPADAILFTPKGPDLPGAIDEVARHWPGQRLEATFVAGVQNGVVKDELLARAFGAPAVVGAATVLGSRRLSTGAVSVSGLGTTFFGEFGSATSPRTESIAATCAGAGLPCVVVPDIRALLWAKFCNAIGIFGVSALTALPSLEVFFRRPMALAYRSLLEEAAAVARAEGITITDFPDLPMRSYLGPAAEDWATEMSSRSRPAGDGPPGFSSMAQDLAAGRPTEIEATFGDLVRRAHTHGLEVPRAELVYRLVSGLEAGPAGPGEARQPPARG